MRPEHCTLDRLFPLRRITRGGEEAEGQDAIRLHRSSAAITSPSVDPCGLHVAKVAQESECAELAAREQTLPVRHACLATRESATSQVSGVASSPAMSRLHTSPGPRHRLGVAEEEHVAQTDHTGAVVLGKRVLVELVNAAARPFFTCAERGTRPSAQ